MRATATIIETRTNGRVRARGTHTNRSGRPPVFAGADVIRVRHRGQAERHGPVDRGDYYGGVDHEPATAETCPKLDAALACLEESR